MEMGARNNETTIPPNYKLITAAILQFIGLDNGIASVIHPAQLPATNCLLFNHRFIRLGVVLHDLG